jgi:hypothetical protein
MLMNPGRRADDHVFELGGRPSAAARVALGAAEHDRALDRRDDQRRESLRSRLGNDGAPSTAIALREGIGLVFVHARSQPRDPAPQKNGPEVG